MPLHVRFFVFAVVLAASACGSSSTTSSGGNPSPAGPVADVSMTDNNGLAPYAFSPATLNIKVGTSVRWTNNGKAQHTATSDATPQPVWSSGTVDPTGTTCTPNPPYPCTPGTTPPGTYVSSPFNTPGTYQYHCEFHGVPGPNFQGMTGTITVTQ